MCSFRLGVAGSLQTFSPVPGNVSPHPSPLIAPRVADGGQRRGSREWEHSEGKRSGELSLSLGRTTLGGRRSGLAARKWTHRQGTQTERGARLCLGCVESTGDPGQHVTDRAARYEEGSARPGQSKASLGPRSRKTAQIDKGAEGRAE